MRQTIDNEAIAVDDDLHRVARTLSEMARFHASTWAQDWPRPFACVTDGIPSSGHRAAWFLEQTPEVFRHYIAERADANVPASVNEPERIVAAFWRLAEISRDPPQCFIHSDAHLDNWYYRPDGSPGLMDWQSPRMGSYAWDVSYYLISALSIEDRRASERDLVRHYRDHLAALVSPAPTFDEAWLGYRQWNGYGLFVKIVNPDYFKPREINVAWMSRHVAATEDLDTFSALGV